MGGVFIGPEEKSGRNRRLGGKEDGRNRRNGGIEVGGNIRVGEKDDGGNNRVRGKEDGGKGRLAGKAGLASCMGPNFDNDKSSWLPKIKMQ